MQNEPDERRCDLCDRKTNAHDICFECWIEKFKKENPPPGQCHQCGDPAPPDDNLCRQCRSYKMVDAFGDIRD